LFLSAIKSAMPWQVKIGAKIVLSRLPVGYGLWSRLNLFKHGPMEDLSYATGVFERHLATWRATGRSGPFTMLELGPGDSLFSALIARRLGASRSWIVDTGAWANVEITAYQRAAGTLFPEGNEQGVDPARWTRIEEMLEDCRAGYLTGGLESLRRLADGSIDLFWSQAVLEHVRRREVGPTFAEMRRLLSPTGVASHVVDFKDHLGGKLNNLRFSEERWESNLFSSSGFYTNRIRCKQMLAQAADAGLAPRLADIKRWEELPTPRAAMHEMFRGLPDDELLVSDIHLVLQLPN